MTFCQCPTIDMFAVVGDVYHCSGCRLPVPDPDDESRPSRVREGDRPAPSLLLPPRAAETKVLRVVEREGSAPEAGPSLYGPCSLGCGRLAERSGYVTALGVYCECGGLFAGLQINPLPPPPSPVGALGPGFWDAVRAAEKGGA